MPRIKKDWIQATVKNCVVGATIRVKPSVSMPRHDFGPFVTHKSIGVVRSINHYIPESIQVDFPEHRCWNGFIPDMEVYVKGA